VHKSDGQQGKVCNWLDLYDMSCNVCEWCQTPFLTSTGQLLWTVCGGHYNSPASDVTANSRAGMDTNVKEKTIGFRLVIRK
jgi:formylglycine-generating enzyme required for sulfatase activity